MGKKTVLILIHGIRTRAEWQEKIPEWLGLVEQVEARPLRYGRFDLIRFLWPFGTRKAPVNKVQKELEYQLALHPEGEWRRIVIAHSFGTYAVTKILEKNPALFLDELMLCGSIVPEDYDWIKISKQIRGQIMNDCSRRDIWPVVAQSVTWGYGATGTYGFGTGTVTNRFHHIGHSDYFTASFVGKYWRPYVRNSKIVPGDVLEKSEGSPWYFSFFSLPLRWAAFAAFVSIGLALAATNPQVRSSAHDAYVMAHEFAVGPYISAEASRLHSEANDLYHGQNDRVAAYAKYKAAADLNNPLSQASLAKMLANGWGIAEPDTKRADLIAANAVQRLESLAQTDADAAYNLSYLYDHGIGVLQDKPLALKYEKTAAENGSAAATFNIAMDLLDHSIDGSLATNQQAIPLLETAADAGHLGAHLHLAKGYLWGSFGAVDVEKAVTPHLRFAESLRNPEGLRLLGDAYANKDGDLTDLKVAADYYEMSADLGDVLARKKLAFAYFRGRGRVEDDNKAAEHFQKAADLGDAGALYELGRLNFRSWSTLETKEVGLAIEYLEAAKKQSIKAAARELGSLFMLGLSTEGVKIDYERAFINFLECAPEIPACSSFLGQIYEDGLADGAADVDLAIKHYDDAISDGYDFAAYRKGRLLKELAIEKDSVAHGQAALAAFTKGIELDPDDGVHYYERGRLYRDGLPGLTPDPVRATTDLLEAAKLGDQDAALATGWRLVANKGAQHLELEPADRLELARSWLLDSAKAGSTTALENLQLFHNFPKLTLSEIQAKHVDFAAINESQATEIGNVFSEFNAAQLTELQDAGLVAAAESAEGNPCLLNHLALRYYEADWAPLDFENAGKLFRIAADAGNAASMYNLGRMHLREEIKPHNYDTGIKLIEQSLEKEFGKAASFLAQIYLEGKYGRSTNVERAKNMLLKAKLFGEEVDEVKLELAQENLSLLDAIARDLDTDVAACGG